jgi:hypothetical protein
MASARAALLALPFLAFSLLAPGCALESPTSPNDNSTVCTCAIVVPLACITSGCGSFGTTPRGTECDFGAHEVVTCAGTAAPQTWCAGDVAATIRAGVMAVYAGCTDDSFACGVRVACAAVRTQRLASCEGECPRVPLVRGNGWNLEEATYVPAESIWCPGATDSPVVCRR